MGNLTNSEDTDEMSHNAAFNQGLHCLLKQMKKVNKQCLLDTPRTVRVSEKTWQVIVRTRRP